MAVKMEQQTLSMQNMVAAEAAGLCYELQDAGRKRKLLTDVLVPQAKQMLALMENEYRTGMSRSLDVLDGQRMLLELEMENLMEQTRELNIRAALLRLLGDNGKGTAQ
jgi:outer membrane protein TolC